MSSAKTNVKQTAKGKFPPGNKVGNRFKKGETGNPKGRPKKTRLTDALREQLQKLSPANSEQSIAEAIADALIQKALSGDVQAIREIGDRTEGKPKQSIDVDMSVTSWKEMARQYGVSEQDVINEARQLITESNLDSGD